MAQVLPDIQVIMLALLALGQLGVFGLLLWRALGLAAAPKAVPAPAPQPVIPHLPLPLPPTSQQTVVDHNIPKPTIVPAPSPPAVIDEALIAFVKKEEGFSAKAYGDFKQMSIGYGTRANPGETTITEAEADIRLREELAHAQAAVEAFIPNAPIGVKQGLTDATYNLGTGWMKQGLGELVKASDWNGASERLKQYNHAGGDVLPALTARREAEAHMFTNPL